MKALIMAAGYGRRLEPLTIAVPKPMVAIVNIPTMQHNLELLKRHGITNITANIHYHPEQIENYFGDGEQLGVKLAYSYEETLLGTAGGVKRMAEIAEVDSTFVILSSDALTDINLKKLVDCHKKNKALMTIALARVKDVSAFGVVVQDESGRITGFQEKPSPEEAKTNLVNAGVYVVEPEVLKMIPNGFYDFGRQMFPELVGSRTAFFGYSMVEYWSDVGCLEKYMESSYDAMRGGVQVRVPGKRVERATWMGNRCRVDHSARFEGAVVIGDSAHIGQDVYIRDAVIGDKGVIEDGAVITGSIIWSDVIIEPGCQVNQAVIGSWCHLAEKARVLNGTVIANRCVVGKGIELPPLTKLQPNSIV